MQPSPWLPVEAFVQFGSGTGAPKLRAALHASEVKKKRRVRSLPRPPALSSPLPVEDPGVGGKVCPRPCQRERKADSEPRWNCLLRKDPRPEVIINAQLTGATEVLLQLGAQARARAPVAAPVSPWTCPSVIVAHLSFLHICLFTLRILIRRHAWSLIS